MRGLHKSYGSVRALRGIDLDLAAGEIVALLGPNGAGKTTLVSIASGLRRADSGSVHVNGINVADRAHAAHAQIGLAPQKIGIYPTISVRGNLQFFGELGGLKGRSLRRRIDDVAAAFDLAGLLGRRGQQLSGGEARRLHTAMAVLCRPSLLLLDEPTAGVDVQTRERVLATVRSLAEAGSGVCYSTHYLQEVEQLGAVRVAILVDGRIAAAGTIGELIQAHGGASVELHFAGPPPRLDLPRGTVQVEGGVLRVHTEGSPAARAASLLAGLGRSTAALREVKLIQPNLESVFLAVTATARGARPEEAAA